MCSAQADVRFVPIADMRKLTWVRPLFAPLSSSTIFFMGSGSEGVTLLTPNTSLAPTLALPTQAIQTKGGISHGAQDEIKDRRAGTVPRNG